MPDRESQEHSTMVLYSSEVAPWRGKFRAKLFVETFRIKGKQFLTKDLIIPCSAPSKKALDHDQICLIFLLYIDFLSGGATRGENGGPDPHFFKSWVV